MKVQIKLLSIVEFEALIKAKLKHNWEHEVARKATENLLAYIMEYGFPKFDKTNLTAFMNGLAGVIWVEAVVVDFDDSTFYWLVSGTNAVLISKKEVETV
jgi:hypothetical protein